MSALHRQSALSALMLFLSLSGVGCISTITARQVSEDSHADGMRYYLPAPYLVVEQSANGQWDANIQLGVDRSRTFTVQPNTYFATSNASVAFNSDGTLKSFSLSQDSTTVSSAVVTALQSIGTKVIDAQAAGTSKSTTTSTGTTPAVKAAKADDSGTGSDVHALVYRIDGQTLIPEAPVAVNIAAGTTSTSGVAGGQPLAIKVSGDDCMIPRCDETPLTQDDIGRLNFFMAGGPPRPPVPDGQATTLRGKATLTDGRIHMAVADLQNSHVQAIALGDSAPTNVSN